ncbi:hypothetical protein ABPG74_013898 [Tetrahymena malaccensis]
MNSENSLPKALRNIQDSLACFDNSHIYFEQNSVNPYKETEPNWDETRRISDPFHSFIELPKSIWRIVDTEEFQRLRYIKQLGMTGFVFNGANHTRFEHCLGVAHLSWTYLDKIAVNHQYKYEQMGLRDADHFDQIKLLVTIAGLCHDLGHGPFSHMFDNVLLPRLGEKQWKHEEGSCMMLKSILLSEEKDFMTNLVSYKNAKLNPKEHIHVILDMIEGLTLSQWQEKYQEKNYYPKWIFDIVSNKTTSIDVDKLDYLKRDPSCLNVKHEFDYNILFNETRIIDGEICYNSKIHDTIYDIFHIRYKLFKHIYLHRVTQAIELMLCDALEKADPQINFLETIKTPERYLRLTDSIIEIIMGQQNCPELAESQQILKRIFTRKLYKFVGETVVDYKKDLTESQVIDGISRHNEYRQICSNSSTKLNEYERKNTIVTFSKINYCMKDQDPVANCYFYKSSKPFEKKKLPSQNSSLLRPQRYGEQIIRVFVKENDEVLINKVKNGFALYTQKELNTETSAYDKKDNLKTPNKSEPQKKIKLNSPQSENNENTNQSQMNIMINGSYINQNNKQLFQQDD